MRGFFQNNTIKAELKFLYNWVKSEKLTDKVGVVLIKNLIMRFNNSILNLKWNKNFKQ